MISFDFSSRDLGGVSIISFNRQLRYKKAKFIQSYI